MGAFDPREGQGGKIPMYAQLGEITAKLLNKGIEAVATGMQFRYGGLLTYEKPIVELYPDILIGASALTTLRAGVELPRNCVSVRFIDVVGAPYISVNGGGARKILNTDSLTNIEVRTLQISTAVGESCTVQTAGTGD